ncbi:uncharacterized protein SPPG_07980 [Spizellomyces punctatus DAOM BR117]|uniref:GATA-type domain-containing protein n=1 Tax=Spizellomyces punctatus (strain DAOM BR117) TaxID=645134 RepID=A0A0L0H7V4_SPIPD|nr:uncharacterized protein SPPG_07980 [Spizellomyces punctatus DAOM BR117]KNC96773.1 hypothetical protein SPPG_07980 [Spizellomyces punctatus DAOM BR117]|eukprot:XP_016604813.1 hypothetical protein SPPG_07980 [Spizellomyces punctatus DAOM BR117]
MTAVELLLGSTSSSLSSSSYPRSPATYPSPPIDFSSYQSGGRPATIKPTSMTGIPIPSRAGFADHTMHKMEPTAGLAASTQYPSGIPSQDTLGVDLSSSLDEILACFKAGLLSRDGYVAERSTILATFVAKACIPGTDRMALLKSLKEAWDARMLSHEEFDIYSAKVFSELTASPAVGWYGTPDTGSVAGSFQEMSMAEPNQKNSSMYYSMPRSTAERHTNYGRPNTAAGSVQGPMNGRSITTASHIPHSYTSHHHQHPMQQHHYASSLDSNAHILSQSAPPVHFTALRNKHETHHAGSNYSQSYARQSQQHNHSQHTQHQQPHPEPQRPQYQTHMRQESSSHPATTQQPPLPTTKTKKDWRSKNTVDPEVLKTQIEQMLNAPPDPPPQADRVPPPQNHRGFGASARQYNMDGSAYVSEFRRTWRCRWCLCSGQYTPALRKGPLGAKTLCNACGMWYNRHGYLPKDRYREHANDDMHLVSSPSNEHLASQHRSLGASVPVSSSLGGYMEERATVVKEEETHPWVYNESVTTASRMDTKREPSQFHLNTTADIPREEVSHQEFLPASLPTNSTFMMRHTSHPSQDQSSHQRFRSEQQKPYNFRPFHQTFTPSPPSSGSPQTQLSSIEFDMDLDIDQNALGTTSSIPTGFFYQEWDNRMEDKGHGLIDVFAVR